MMSRKLMAGGIAGLLLMALGLLGCSGSNSDLSGDQAVAPDLTALPGLPQDAAVPHSPTAVTDAVLNGSDAASFSAGASIDGNAIDLDAVSSGIEYAIFEFVTGVPGTDTFSVALETSLDAGAEYWVGLSDYADGIWDFRGPFTGDSDLPLTTGNYLSGQGNFYIAVITADGNSATVNTVTFNYEDGTTPGTNYVDDAGPFLTANCASCHGGSSPLAGVGYDSFRAATANANAMISTVVDGTHRGLDAADKEMLQAWVDDGLLYGAAVTYDADIQPIVAMSCSPCHTSGSSGGVNLNSFAGASVNANNALAEILAETMPQTGGPLDEDEKDLWQVWVDDGTPEN